MLKLVDKPFSVRLRRTTHAPLREVAKFHRRSQASMIDWLVAEEYQRLVDAGKIKESRGNQEPDDA